MNETVLNQTADAMFRNYLNCIGGCGSGLGFFVVLGIVTYIGVIILLIYDGYKQNERQTKEM
jgi:hypothetical protein